MARLKREDLKILLKECLLEILTEEKLLTPLKESQASNRPMLSEVPSHASSSPFASHFASNQHNKNNTNINSNQQVNQNPPHYAPQTINNNKNAKLIESVQSVANAFGENSSLFADLLADTAMTTLQAQRNGGMPGDRLSDGMILESYVEEESRNDVTNLQSLAPDGDMKKWAKFAFAKKE